MLHHRLGRNLSHCFLRIHQKKVPLAEKRVKHFLLRKCHTSPTICRMPKLSFSVLEMNYNILKYLSLLPFKEISQSSSSTEWKLEWFSWRVVLSPWPLCQKHFAPSAWWLFSWRHFFPVEFRKWITCAWIFRVLLRSWTLCFSEWLQLGKVFSSNNS